MRPAFQHSVDDVDQGMGDADEAQTGRRVTASLSPEKRCTRQAGKKGSASAAMLRI